MAETEHISKEENNKEMDDEEFMQKVREEASNLDFRDIEERYKVDTDRYSTDTILVIDGICVHLEEEKDQCVGFLNKVLKDTNIKFDPDLIFYPCLSASSQENQVSISASNFQESEHAPHSYIMVEFPNEQDMFVACEAFNRLPVPFPGKILVAFPLRDVGRLKNVDILEYKKCVDPYQESPYRKEWLRDPEMREQFLVTGKETLSLHWNIDFYGDSLAISKESGDNFGIRNRPVWSNTGAYIATIHEQGVILWCVFEDDLVVYERLPHLNVLNVTFSHKDKYILTLSEEKSSGEKDKDKYVFVLWEFNITRTKKAFKVAKKTESEVPSFLFSKDDKYLGYVVKSQLYMLSLDNEKMQIMENISLTDINRLVWSCVAPRMFAISQKGPSMSRVSIYEAKNQQLTLVKTKEMFEDADYELLWNEKFNYLAVKVIRKQGYRNKSGSKARIEIFRMADKGIPIESLSLSSIPVQIYWEYGSKLLVVCQDEKAKLVKFFDTQAKKNPRGERVTAEIEIGKTLATKMGSASSICWSPKGRFLAVNYFEQSNFQTYTEVWCFDDDNKIKEFNTYNFKHQVNTLEWNKSGKYLIFYYNADRNATSDYYIVNLAGETKHMKEDGRIKEIKWRPRPHFELGRQKTEEIERNIAHYADMFSKMDAENMERNLRESSQHKTLLLEQWHRWRKNICDEWNIDYLPGAVAIQHIIKEDNMVTIEEEVDDE